MLARNSDRGSGARAPGEATPRAAGCALARQWL